MATPAPAHQDRPTNDDLLFIISDHQRDALRQADIPPAHPLNTACPVHAVVLYPKQPPALPETIRGHNLLAWMPPIGLTAQFQVGTSSSCGCTCGQGTRKDIQDFVRDVDRTLPTSVATTKDPMIIRR
jgi:hypothetical protein